METCRRHLPKKPVVIPKNKCICQGLCLLKEFTTKHKEKECKPWHVPGPSYKAAKFVTGSKYEGDWSEAWGMHGYGEYTFPSGAVYEGEFDYGVMHGKGELRYQTRAGQVIIRGQWKNDVMIERTLILNGTMEYNEKEWNYCKMPDRRYSAECGVGVQPAGASFLTSYKPVRKIPAGYYDVGYGVYDPVVKLIYSYDCSKCIKSPAEREQKWILENCRLGKAISLGPRKELYETYLQPTLQPAPVPPPQNITKTKKFTRLTRFTLPTQ